RVIALHLERQPGVAEAHPVAGGGPEQLGVVGARDLARHLTLLRNAALRRVREPLRLRALHRSGAPGLSHWTGGEPVSSADDAPAGDVHELHRLGLARLEANGRPGWNVEPPSVGDGAIE